LLTSLTLTTSLMGSSCPADLSAGYGRAGLQREQSDEGSKSGDEGREDRDGELQWAS